MFEIGPKIQTWSLQNKNTYTTKYQAIEEMIECTNKILDAKYEKVNKNHYGKKCKDFRGD